MKTITIKLISIRFKALSDNNEKSRWKKVASKEITLEEFHSESCKRRVI